MQHKRHDFDGRRHQIDHDRFGAVQDKDAYKKLFVLSGKEPSADEFRTIFAVYGEVEDVVRMQNDRNSTKFKGAKLSPGIRDNHRHFFPLQCHPPVSPEIPLFKLVITFLIADVFSPHMGPLHCRHSDIQFYELLPIKKLDLSP